MDFDQNKPYLEVRVSKSSEDARDELISAFMEKGQHGQMRPWFTYVGRDEVKDLDYWRLDWIDPTEPVEPPIEWPIVGGIVFGQVGDGGKGTEFIPAIYHGFTEDGRHKCRILPSNEEMVFDNIRMAAPL